MRGILFSLAFVFAAGCYTEADMGGGGAVVYGGAPAPALVEVSPGVQVIADYDEPIFFSDGLYWRSYGGTWYSSRVYNGGWAVNYNAPYAVRGINNPGMYAHYRGGTAVYGGRPAYNGGYNGGYRGGYQGGAVVRDHRSAPATYSRPGPVVRDHRR